MGAYRGCLVPRCKRRGWARGVCFGCYTRIMKKNKREPGIVSEMVRLGVMLPPKNERRGKSVTFAVEIEAGSYRGWLPNIKTCEKPDSAIDQAMINATSLDVMGMPDSVVAKFQKSDLVSIARKPTRFSPGTFEKQVVLQLRSIHGIAFGRGSFKGLHHPNDNRDFGNGTVFVRTESRESVMSADSEFDGDLED